MMEEALIAKLLASSQITFHANDRIWWLTRPQGKASLPALVMQTISDTKQVTFDGPNLLCETGIQFDCWGISHFMALNVSRALKASLEGVKFTQDDTEFQGSFVDNERHFFEEPNSSSPERYYRVSIDMRVWHFNLG